MRRRGSRERLPFPMILHCEGYNFYMRTYHLLCMRNYKDWPITSLCKRWRHRSHSTIEGLSHIWWELFRLTFVRIEVTRLITVDWASRMYVLDYLYGWYPWRPLYHKVRNTRVVESSCIDDATRLGSSRRLSNCRWLSLAGLPSEIDVWYAPQDILGWHWQ